jgi:hypothetical protein
MMGMDKDLTNATQIAVQQAIDFVAAYRGWSKMEARTGRQGVQVGTPS